MAASPITGTVWERGGAVVMARVQGTRTSGVADNMDQSDIDGVTYWVYEKYTSGYIATSDNASQALTVADVVYNTLQTDNRWTVDSTGYNFRHTLTSTAFPTGGRAYRAQYLFNPNKSGEPAFWVVFDITAKSLPST
jgi:hypothetical protein